MKKAMVIKSDKKMKKAVVIKGETFVPRQVNLSIENDNKITAFCRKYHIYFTPLLSDKINEKVDDFLNDFKKGLIEVKKD